MSTQWLVGLGYLHVKIGIQGVVGPISATEEVAEAGGRIGMKNRKMRYFLSEFNLYVICDL